MTSEATTAAETIPVIRSDIWFGDGNIVLEAGRVQFKVHGPGECWPCTRPFSKICLVSRSHQFLERQC
ncbi:hypothetical protein FIBSPDRAFT_855648 [Athelia psychrophila]|uniref:Uncharacterized protein n=1 Tax=Athelia psychrophila TaxID=1759441 RepID=A0A166P612_9AGAM|nr:hypothetical protein FIBSPDRAFT_855648 [Fibularhizoctonia sp. CBS 109695]